GRVGVGPPPGDVDQAGCHQLQAVEEVGGRRGVAQVVRGGAGFVVLPGGLHPSAVYGGAVVVCQVAAGGQARHQPLHDRACLVVVGDVAEDPQQHQRGGLGQVQCLGGVVQDRVRFVYIGVDVVDDPVGAAVEQGTGVDQHQRVVVHIDDAGLRRD